jgi:hypothetical protein
MFPDLQLYKLWAQTLYSEPQLYDFRANPKLVQVKARETCSVVKLKPRAGNFWAPKCAYVSSNSNSNSNNDSDSNSNSNSISNSNCNSNNNSNCSLDLGTQWSPKSNALVPGPPTVNAARVKTKECCIALTKIKKHDTKTKQQQNTNKQHTQYITTNHKQQQQQNIKQIRHNTNKTQTTQHQQRHNTSNTEQT